MYKRQGGSCALTESGKVEVNGNCISGIGDVLVSVSSVEWYSGSISEYCMYSVDGLKLVCFCVTCETVCSVSYTHLDVYKRQGKTLTS